MEKTFSVIIPAAGTGGRFQSRLKKAVCSKLFLPLNGKPLLSYSIASFRECAGIRELIIAARPSMIPFLKRRIIAPVAFPFPVRIVKGGKTRAESVWRALKTVSAKSSHIVIHDGARPLLNRAWILKLFRDIKDADGIVLGRHVIPTVKRLETGRQEVAETLDRQQLFEAETPQVFQKSVLAESYRMLGRKAFLSTDEAAIVEMAGGKVQASFHDGHNLKITTSDDLALARRMIHPQEQTLRFGLGFDTHRLVRGRPFYLGGVRLAVSFGPVGHSDGDPLIHAVMDGMLGALALGDIGDFFPDTQAAYRNIKSRLLAAQTIKLILKHGFRLSQIDATVTLEKPKLGSKKREIQKAMAKLFQLSAGSVSVKAKTAEGLTPEGQGLAVSARALVVLQPEDV